MLYDDRLMRGADLGSRDEEDVVVQGREAPGCKSRQGRRASTMLYSTSLDADHLRGEHIDWSWSIRSSPDGVWGS